MKLHHDKLKARIYTYMTRVFEAEMGKFGTTKADALSRTRQMVRDEADTVGGLTGILRSYLNDLEAAFAVFNA